MPDPYYTPPSTDQNGTLYAVAAAGYVQQLAPVPEPETDDYVDKAEAAEFLVYNYLQNTSGGSVASESARGVSATYLSLGVVSSLIAPVMGDYFGGASANTGYVEDFA